jgi:hypothetical protein
MSDSLINYRILDEVDEIVVSALEKKDPTVATQYGRFLMDGVRMSGVALAKLLYRVRSEWDLFQDAGVDDDFYSVVESEMGVDVDTARKYANAWGAIFVDSHLSDDVKKRLLGKPMRILLLLPALAGEDNVDWEEVINAHDKNEVRRIVREKRGEATSSKTALIIRLDLRTGQLTAVRGDGIREPFGMFAMDKAKTNEVVAHAINRIIQDTGIQVV